MAPLVTLIWIIILLTFDLISMCMQIQTHVHWPIIIIQIFPSVKVQSKILQSLKKNIKQNTKRRKSISRSSWIISLFSVIYFFLIRIRMQKLNWHTLWWTVSAILASPRLGGVNSVPSSPPRPISVSSSIIVWPWHVALILGIECTIDITSPEANRNFVMTDADDVFSGIRWMVYAITRYSENLKMNRFNHVILNYNELFRMVMCC